MNVSGSNDSDQVQTLGQATETWASHSLSTSLLLIMKVFINLFYSALNIFQGDWGRLASGIEL